MPFERVVFALGIRFVGETSAKLLARHFKTMEALRNASVEQLMEVDGIGEVIAKSVVTYFHNHVNEHIVDRLAAFGLRDGTQRRTADRIFGQACRQVDCHQRRIRKA